jgi:ubiquinone/menaquinone biosynthesis C-methylase UbiE
MSQRPALPDAEAVYDAIAEAWVRTRSGAWPAVTSFLAGLSRGLRVADVGAGSGRYLTVPEARGLRMVAVDVSRAQLAIARRQVGASADLVRGDARRMPLRTACVDGALHIAVLHHFFERAERVDGLRELHRVMRAGGRALVSSWGEHADVFTRARRVDGGGPRDFLVPFKEALATPVARFFHAYEPGELEGEAREAGFRGLAAWSERENQFVEVTR